VPWKQPCSRDRPVNSGTALTAPVCAVLAALIGLCGQTLVEREDVRSLRPGLQTNTQTQ